MSSFINKIPLLWKSFLFLVVLLVFFILQLLFIVDNSYLPHSFKYAPWLRFFIVILIASLYFLGFKWINKLVKQLDGIKTATKALSLGKTSNKIHTGPFSDLKEIEVSINRVIDRMIETSKFTTQIESFESSSDYGPLSEDDHLSYNLIELKKTLTSHRQAESIRNWNSESHSKCAEILRSQENIKVLASEVLKYILRCLKASQGALFILESDDKGNQVLNMKACYAYQRIKSESLRLLPGEGLVGQTFLEKETTYIRRVPNDYVRIKSGLGDSNPDTLLIVPLKLEEQVIGVLELASFAEFKSYEIEFVEQIGNNIAHTISSIQIAEKTKKLLDDSLAQAEQLKSQEEELRQNQEELQATQEEISRKYNALFNKLTELNYQSKFEQLKAINSAKKRNIEYYFDIIRNQILTFSENKMVVDAVNEFKSAFYKIDEQVDKKQFTKIKTSVEKYYQEEFILKLNENYDSSGSLDEFLPADLKTILFQYLYISNNPHPTGQKALLHDAGDKSDYSRIHSLYHPLLKNFLEKFGYYDIFLIDSKTGDMLYSVFKEVDFATNLINGIYSDTNFGRVVQEAINSTERDFVKLIDFQPYAPSYRAPASFIACPVYDNETKVGVLVFQMPINKINQILTGDNNWKMDGLGDTGETVIVGSDSKLRSISRKLTEQKEEYYASMERVGYNLETIHKIQKSNTSILLEEMDTEFVRKAANGETGTCIEPNNFGIASLAAFAPLQIPDVDWVIISSMEEEEASFVINDLKKL